MNNVLFAGNVAYVSGGAIEVSLTVINANFVTFINNYAGEYVSNGIGGAINSDRLILNCFRCNISDNFAFNGGGLYVSDSEISFKSSLVCYFF